jgi:hypothetical protein
MSGKIQLFWGTFGFTGNIAIFDVQYFRGVWEQGKSMGIFSRKV